MLRVGIAAILIVTLGGCSTWGADDGLGTEELSAVESGYLSAVVDYGSIQFVPAARTIDSAVRHFEAERFALAARDFESALQSLPNDAVHGASKLLVLDWLVRTSLAVDDYRTADVWQHAYHAIAKLSDSPAVKGRADFRLGCWHFILRDWNESLFDFERAIRHLESSDDLSVFDRKLLHLSPRLADEAGYRCESPW